MGQEFLTIKEIAQEWGVTVRRVQMLCNEGLIFGAVKEGKSWLIPANAKRPADHRRADERQERERAQNLEQAQFWENNKRFNLAFLSGMSYGIRTSLNDMFGYTQMLRKRRWDTAKPDEYLDGIESAGDEIITFVENAMEIACLEQGMVSVHEDICQLKGVWERVRAKLRAEAERKNITFFRRSKLLHHFVYADIEKMECILENLLKNAIDYSGPGASIRVDAKEISATDTDCVIRYTIEDRGSGLDEETVEHIFDLFTHDSSNPRRLVNGTFLGMARTKRLVDLLGGTIKVDSHPGFGTKVQITLQHRIASVTDYQELRKSRIDWEEIRGKHVLLAEDNELNREMITEMLVGAGLTVDCVEDGILCVAAIEKMDAGYFDFILMDIQMPNMNGFAATKLIRALSDEKKNKIPIIAVTANVQQENREKAKECGMDGFVEKPCSIQKLFSEIHEVLQRRKERYGVFI